MIFHLRNQRKFHAQRNRKFIKFHKENHALFFSFVVYYEFNRFPTQEPPKKTDIYTFLSKIC